MRSNESGMGFHVFFLLSVTVDYTIYSIESPLYTEV